QSEGTLFVAGRPTLTRAVALAGIVIGGALLCSVAVLATSPTDSSQRELGHGAVAATSLLVVVWELAAVGVAIARWRESTMGFRVVLALNSAIVFLLAMTLLGWI